MKTKSLLDKYRTILAKLAKVPAKDISFWARPNSSGTFLEIGKELDPKKKDYLRDWCLGQYEVRLANQKEKVLASFKLYQLPHCCGIVVSCKAFTNEAYRGMRIGTVMNDLRQSLGSALGYSLILCTDLANNTAQTKLFQTNGWRVIEIFINRRSGNTLNITTKGLK